ncbi:MAG: winged helix-turn-helix transcriptional regulator [Verrucomicrobia bacterium]|jgi:ATP-dependent DNA helicase RecG|nr:winged helix-turn-helix transcriptional regulator [Verrucomicrobiota bacterium]
MLKKELQQIIKNGENSGIEFKRDDVRPEQLAKEVVAMANLNGGRLLIGVEDNGDVSGITRPDLEAWIIDTVFGRYIHPTIIPFYEEVQWDAEKRVAAITFTTGAGKPYVVRSKDREDIYVRLGSQSRLATREQQARLFSSGGLLHSELLPVPGTTMETMDLVRIENYLKVILNDPDIPNSAAAWEERLLNLGFLVNSTDGKSACTMAGLVLFGVKPRRFLKQSGMRLVVYQGGDKEYKALLDRVLDAPLLGRWSQQAGKKELVDHGLIEEFIEALRPFIYEEGSDIDPNLRREGRWKYPLEAIRETVINAFIHRDWTRSVEVEVNLYADRLEVVSPGALPNSMTVDKMIAGLRSPRNPILVEVLRDYGYVDARGMGVRTKIIPLMRAGGSEAVFEASEDYLRTVLRQIKGQKSALNASINEKYPAISANVASLNLLQRQIIEFIEADSGVSYEKLAEMTQKDISTIRRNIQKLKGMALLEREGSKKTGKWRLK